MQLDLSFVRQHFTQLHDDADLVFASNAGGSYVCNQVNSVLEHYNRHTRVQPYSDFVPSSSAGEAMDRAKDSWAKALNIKSSELTIGPSTSMNTYVTSHAISKDWKAGDEIIISNQDHEANIGSWQRIAEQKGVTVHFWEVDGETGLLDIDKLTPLLNEKTRWVFFTHCSNVAGTVNPVKQIASHIRQHCAARIFIDAVAYAPHHISDLSTLGVDAYVFSLYKVYGPHQSLLYTSSELQATLASQAHYFLADDVNKYLNPAGPQHAQVAACAGVLDYFDLLHAHHGGDANSASNDKMADLFKLIHTYEESLTGPVLDYLVNSPVVRVIGKTHLRDRDRAPTISFKPLKQTSSELTQTLQAAGIGTENGDFYATRLIEALGIEAIDGVIRLSLLHYNTAQDVDKILLALDSALA